MATFEEFIGICKRAIERYEADKLSLRDAAAEINSSPTEYPLKEHVHPMLYKIADLAFDIAEDYRSEHEDKPDWKILTKTLKDYEKGSWEPTCWILSAMYGVYENDRLEHSFSATIKRQNGETVIDCAASKLRMYLVSAVAHVNNEQTDERYLQNVTKFLPDRVGKLRFSNYSILEYLTEPYYTTHQ